MLPFGRTKHVYHTVGLVQWLKYGSHFLHWSFLCHFMPTGVYSICLYLSPVYYILVPYTSYLEVCILSASSLTRFLRLGHFTIFWSCVPYGLDSNRANNWFTTKCISPAHVAQAGRVNRPQSSLIVPSKFWIVRSATWSRIAGSRVTNLFRYMVSELYQGRIEKRDICSFEVAEICDKKANREKRAAKCSVGQFTML